MWEIVSALAGVLSASCAWYGIFRKGWLGVKKREREYCYGKLPEAICICDKDGKVIYCNEKFAKHFNENHIKIQHNMNVSDLFNIAGQALTYEGALVTAKEVWKSKFELSKNNPGTLYYCPPFEFSDVNSPRHRIVGFRFFTLREDDGHYDIYFGLDYLCVTYEITSTLQDCPQWDLGISISYHERGHPFKFAPDLALIQSLFAALERSGDYACVGSSAVRIHGGDFDVSSIDIIIPNDVEKQKRFLENLDNNLKDKWNKSNGNKNKILENHKSNGVVAEYTSKKRNNRGGFNLTLVRKIGKWYLDNKASNRTRIIRRSNVRARYLSLEDTILIYISFNPMKEKSSIHSKALREMVRALIYENCIEHVGELENSADRMGFTAEEKKLAMKLYQKVINSKKTFEGHYGSIHARDFNKSWNKLKKENKICSFLLSD